MQSGKRSWHLRAVAWVAIAMCLVLALVAAAIQLAILAVGAVVVLVVVIALVLGWNALMGRLGWHLPAPGPRDRRAQQSDRARRRGRSL